MTYTNCKHNKDDVRVKFSENGRHTFTLRMCPVCVKEANNNNTIAQHVKFTIWPEEL